MINRRSSALAHDHHAAQQEVRMNTTKRILAGALVGLGLATAGVAGVAAAAPPMTPSMTVTSPTTGTSAPPPAATHQPGTARPRTAHPTTAQSPPGTATVDAHSKGDEADSGGTADTPERGDKQDRQADRADHREVSGARDTNHNQHDVQHGTDRSDRR